MKIEEFNPNPTPIQPAIVRPDKPETAEAHGEAIAKQQSATDKVELSSYMPVVPSSKRRVDFNAERVEELKTQIQAGTYDISGKDVAKKMLSKIVLSNTK